MSYQLIYTSAGKLLEAGKSGFGTVARSKGLSPMAAGMIERFSQFSNIRGTDRSRIIYSHRKITVGSNRIHVLSRIADAGVDYTGRTNHIAHHLAFSQQEAVQAAAAGITPADILMGFQWMKSWGGNPKLLNAEYDVQPTQFVAHGKQAAGSAWSQITGNPLHARLVAWEETPKNGVLMLPVGSNPLRVMSEALHECGPDSWNITFTTSLESTDELADFDWIVTNPNDFATITSRCGSRQVLDTTKPNALPLPPEAALNVPKLPEIGQVGAGQTAIQPSAQGQARSTIKATTQGQSSLSSSKANTRRAPADLEQIYKNKRASGIKPILLGGLAAALLVVGILLVLEKSPETKDNDSQTVEAEQSDVEKELQELGINEGDIERIVLAGAAAESWLQYLRDTVYKLQRPDEAIEDGLVKNWPEPPENPVTGLNWLNEAANGRRQIEIALDHKLRFRDRIVAIDKAYKGFKGLEENLSSGVKPESIDELDCILTKILIEDALGKPDSSEPLSSELIKEVRSDLLNEDRKQGLLHPKVANKRFKILCDHFAQMFESDHPSVKPLFGELLNDHDVDGHFKGVQNALKIKSGEITKLKNSDRGSISKSDITRKEAEEYLNAAISKPEEVVSKDVKPKEDHESISAELKNIPKTQYILMPVGSGDSGLYEKVYVHLLAYLFKDTFSNKLEDTAIDNLSVKIEPPLANKDATGTQKLFRNIDGYYSWTRNKADEQIQYHVDHFTYNPKNTGVSSVEAIEFNYTLNKLEWKAVVLSQEQAANHKDLASRTFSIHKTGENSAEIKGEIKEVLSQLYGKDGGKLGDLRLRIEGNPSLKISMDGDKIICNRVVTAGKIKRHIISSEDESRLIGLQNKCKEKAYEVSGAFGEKEKVARKEMVDVFEETRNEILRSIRRAMISAELGQPGKFDKSRVLEEAEKKKITFKKRKKNKDEKGNEIEVDTTQDERLAEIVDKWVPEEKALSYLEIINPNSTTNEYKLWNPELVRDNRIGSDRVTNVIELLLVKPTEQKFNPANLSRIHAYLADQKILTFTKEGS